RNLQGLYRALCSWNVLTPGVYSSAHDWPRLSHNLMDAPRSIKSRAIKGQARALKNSYASRRLDCFRPYLQLLSSRGPEPGTRPLVMRRSMRNHAAISTGNNLRSGQSIQLIESRVRG